MDSCCCCPLCGDETTEDDSSNETNTARLMSSQEYRTVFECFIRLFEIISPPWFEKAFVFCTECTRMLTVVSELEKVLKEVEKRLKESEQVVKDRLKGSEGNFEMSGVYQRDRRYWRVRGEILSKIGSLSAGLEVDLSQIDTFSGVGSSSPSPTTAECFQDGVDLLQDLTEASALNHIENYKYEGTITVFPSSTSELSSLEEDGGAGTDKLLTTTIVDFSQSSTEEENESRKRQLSQISPEAFGDVDVEDYDPKKMRHESGGELELDFDSEFNLDKFFEDEENPYQNGEQFVQETQIINIDDDVEESTQQGQQIQESSEADAAIDGDIDYEEASSVIQEDFGDEYQVNLDILILNNINSILSSKTPSPETQLDNNFTPSVEPNHCDDDGDDIFNQNEEEAKKKIYDLLGVQAPIPPPQKKKLPCPICEKPVHHLKSHKWSHYSKQEKAEALARGEKPPHSSIKKFQCVECDKKCQSFKGLLKHQNYFHDFLKSSKKIQEVDTSTISIHDVLLKKVDGENCVVYSCSKCNAILDISEVAKHVIKEHTSIYECDHCGKRFHKKYLLEIHLKSSHKLGDQNFCRICRHPFYGKKPPRRHIWTHFSVKDRQDALARGEKVPFGIAKIFQCEKCPSSYTCRAELIRHQKQIHEKQVERKVCQVCNASVSDLGSHMRVKHPKEEDFRFVCSICDKKFVRHTLLKKHRETHVKDMQFKCEFCEKEFRLEEQLRLHRKWHLNINPHQCPHCSMAFTRKQTLRRHVQGVHEGKKFKKYPRPKKQLQNKEVEMETVEVVVVNSDDDGEDSDVVVIETDEYYENCDIYF